MTSSHDPTIEKVVTRFFEDRQRGRRSSLDDLLREFADAGGEPDLRREVLRRISLRSRFGSSQAFQRAGEAWEGEPPGEPGSAGASPSLPPPELDGYDIIDQIGRGGMGVVYEAYQQSTGRRVAIKFMLDSAAASEVTRRRFEREVEMVARLQHPHIVSVLDSGLHHGQYYYVMEYIEGRPLDEALKPGECQVRSALRLMTVIAEAVDYAHQRGVLHRDLKPSNILVVEEGTEAPAAAGKLHDEATKGADSKQSATRKPQSAMPKILDFGLAKAIGDSAPGSRRYTLSEPGQLMGTLAYMSPEQSRGELDQLSVRSDVYALGAIAYELVTGKLPHDVDTALADVFVSIATADPTRPSLHRAGLGADLDAILLKALERDAARRYATAAEFSADIRRCLNHEPIQARRAGVSRRAARWVQRNPLVTGVAGAATAVIIVIAAIAFVNVVQERDRARAEADRANRTYRFLEGTLTAQPEMLEDGDVTLREVLDDAAARADRELVDEPRILGAALATIGNSYTSLGAYAQAEPLLRRALAMRESVYGPEHPEVAQSQNYLATLLEKKGELEEAQVLHEAALKMFRQTAVPHDPVVATSIGNLGLVLLNKGDYDGAEPLLREALEEHRHLLGNDAAEVAVDLNNMALLLKRRGNAAAAEPLYREAIAIQRVRLGDEHVGLANTLCNLASLLVEKQALAEAEPLYREALAIQQAALGDQHVETAITLDCLGALLTAKGDFDAAERAIGDALAIFESQFGPMNPDVAQANVSLARVHIARGKFAQAEPPVRAAVAGFRATLGEEHLATLTASCTLAMVLGRLDQKPEANAIFGDCVTALRRTFESGHPALAHALLRWGELWLSDDPQVALPLAQEGLDMCGGGKAGYERVTALAEAMLGRCLAALDRYEEAKPLLEHAIQALQEYDPPGSRDLSDAVECIVNVCTAMGHDAEAERYRLAATMTP